MLITTLFLCTSACISYPEGQKPVQVDLSLGNEWVQQGTVGVRISNLSGSEICLDRSYATPAHVNVERSGQKVEGAPLPLISQPGDCVVLSDGETLNFAVDASHRFVGRQAIDRVCYAVEYELNGDLHEQVGCARR
jgi:hypothetical protein